MEAKRRNTLIVFVIVILVSIGVIGILYLDEDKEKEKDDSMYFEIDRGTHIDKNRGCFFIIRAGKNVNIDPSEYSFFVCEIGYTPQRLDFSLREYDKTAPFGPIPSSGDRNGTYDYTKDGNLWSEGEYIGFDMPMEDMDVRYKFGNLYNVSIKDPKGVCIYKDWFGFYLDSTPFD